MNLAQAGVVTAIGRTCIAVVASFAHFNDAIATAGVDANVGPCKDIAEFTHGAIRSFIASTRRPNRIAETAGACHRAAGAQLTDFEQANAGAAVAIRLVVVVARFARFDDAITTTGNDADVGIGRNLANGRPRGAICIFVAYARPFDRVARSARTRRRIRTSFAQFEQTTGAATIAIHLIAVVTAFARFHNGITAAGIDANIRIRLDVAELDAGAIIVLVTCANHSIAEPAGANRSGCTRLPKFLQALRIATVAIVQIAIVAPLTRGDGAIATTQRYALIRSERRVAV